jgi:hypothetical protein
LVADILNNGGANVRVDLPGFAPPERIVWTTTREGHVPDVTADLLGQRFVFEVETPDTLSSSHTESQLKLFGTFAGEHNHVCCLVVPSVSYFSALLLVWRLRVPIQIVRY